jgi:hypothetical protein
MDLSNLPEPPATYEEAVALLQKLITEGESYQRRLSQINSEIGYYQGVAKTLELKQKKAQSLKKD